MACRIGITTDPGRRDAEWRNEHPNLRWQILGKFSTKAEAQKAENDWAAKYGCSSHAGGPEAGGEWYVYKFDY